MAPRVFLPRLVEVALRPVHVAQRRVRSRFVRREGLRLLHVLQRLVEVAWLTEHVRETEGRVRDEHAGRERQGFRDRSPGLVVPVQPTLDACQCEPGARAAGILLNQLLPQRELARQVLVESLAHHLDLEPLCLGRSRGMLLGERQIALELGEGVGRVRDIQVAEGEVRIRRDGLLEMRVRVDRIDANIGHIRGEQSAIRLCSASHVEQRAPDLRQLVGQVPPDGGGL